MCAVYLKNEILFIYEGFYEILPRMETSFYLFLFNLTYLKNDGCIFRMLRRLGQEMVKT